MHNRRFVLPCVLVASLLPVSCRSDLDGDRVAVSARDATPVHVDSIFPMPEMIARFQAAMPREPQGLGTTAAATRDELVQRFVHAVESGDAEALAALRLDQAEFAYIYFPASRFARPPLAQPPQTTWLMIEQNGVKGETRLLRRFGGKPLGYRGYDCDEPPAEEGSNRLWEDCSLLLSNGDRIRLFGSILEHGGRFKFVSMANKL